MPDDIYSSERKDGGDGRVTTSAPVTRKKRKFLSTEQKAILREKLKKAPSKKPGSISPEKMKIWKEEREKAGVVGRRLGRGMGLLRRNPMAEERSHGQRGEEMRRAPAPAPVSEGSKFQEAERRFTIPRQVAAPAPLSPVASLSNIGLERPITVRRRK